MFKRYRNSPNNCENLVDTRGPYKTENECEDRLFEIESIFLNINLSMSQEVIYVEITKNKKVNLN